MMHIGQKWHCVNPRCCAELVITESSQLVDANQPRCGCGTLMKRVYERPTALKIVLTIDEAHGDVPGKARVKG